MTSTRSCGCLNTKEREVEERLCIVGKAVEESGRVVWLLRNQARIEEGAMTPSPACEILLW
jgi:hypothetical protein